MGVVFPIPFEMGIVLSIELINRTKNFSHKLLATVVHSSPQADGHWFIGFRFVNRFSIGGRSYKVIPQLLRVERLNPEQLKDIYVTGPNGQLIALSTIATIKRAVATGRMMKGRDGFIRFGRSGL